MTSGRKPITQDKIDMMISLRMSGKTNEDVAEIMGLSAATVAKYTKGCPTGKTSNITKTKLVAEEKRKNKEKRKMAKDNFCIPVVFGGMSTV